MVVEASIHERPIIAVTINSETGWPGQYSLKLTEIGKWPTHGRFRAANAGIVVDNAADLKEALNRYLENPEVDLDAQRAFIRQECSYTDSSAGCRTAEFFLSILDKAK